MSHLGVTTGVYTFSGNLNEFVLRNEACGHSDGVHFDCGISISKLLHCFH